MMSTFQVHLVVHMQLPLVLQGLDPIGQEMTSYELLSTLPSSSSILLQHLDNKIKRKNINHQ